MTSQPAVLLTRRAVRDIREIAAYSKRQWGDAAAERYVDELQLALVRIGEQPALLRAIPDLTAVLKFYVVNQHLLICDVEPQAIVVLTLIHARMDLPARLAELQPGLNADVEALHKKMRRK